MKKPENIEIKSIEHVRKYASLLISDNEAIDEWIKRPLKAFGGKSVLDKIESESWEDLQQMFLRLLSGELS